jgi:hypothetical protein
MTDEAPQQQKKLDSFAAGRVKQWNGFREDDYDFRSWAKGASRERLEAGCLYEYARESRKLRGLLVLMNPKRKRKPFEVETDPGNGEQFDLPCSFEGLQEREARRVLGSLRWLVDFADPLADNKSFAELFRTNPTKLDRSFVKRPLHFLTALQLALPFLGEKPWPWREFIPLILPHERPIGSDGSENIAIRVRWGHFTNGEIGKAMKEFARAYRPPDEAAKEPRRQGTRRKITIQSHLNALSVMRIWKHERNQWKRLNLVAQVCGYKGCEKEAAAYKDRCKDGHADQPMNKAAKVEMTKARKRALSLFRLWFPWENPANY